MPTSICAFQGCNNEFTPKWRKCGGGKLHCVPCLMEYFGGKNVLRADELKQCQYFKDDKGVGGDCYVEQNGKAKFREEFGVFFCNHHYQKLSEIVN